MSNRSPEQLIFSQYDYLDGFPEYRARKLREYKRESFAAAFAVLWGYQDVDETEGYWRIMARFSPDDCEEILAILDSALAEPPDDLAELLETFGRMHLIRKEQNDRGEGPFTSEDYQAWLADQIDSFRSTLAHERRLADPN